MALVPMGDAAELAADALLAELRAAGLSAERAWRGNVKKRMERAAKSGARFAVILGDDELAAGEVTLKALASGTQRRVAVDGLLAAVAAAN